MIDMANHLWGSAHPDFAQLIANCCADPSDEQFKEFRVGWREFLNGDLTQFVSDAQVMDGVCDAAEGEYRRRFLAGYRPHFDYGLYFRAVAYSHLSHMRGDRGVQNLLGRVSGVKLVENVGHDLCIVIFLSILAIKDGCAAFLLDVCFELNQLALDRRDCVRGLREALGGLDLDMRTMS
jgi:hypothetical protein